MLELFPGRVSLAWDAEEAQGSGSGCIGGGGGVDRGKGEVLLAVLFCAYLPGSMAGVEDEGFGE